MPTGRSLKQDGPWNQTDFFRMSSKNVRNFFVGHVLNLLRSTPVGSDQSWTIVLRVSKALFNANTPKNDSDIVQRSQDKLVVIQPLSVQMSTLDMLVESYVSKK